MMKRMQISHLCLEIEREGEKKIEECIPIFICLVCARKGNEKKNVFFFFFKCERWKKVMGKYVISSHSMLFMSAPFIFKNHCFPSNTSKLGELQNFGPKRNSFYHFLFFHVTKQMNHYLSSYLFSLLFSSDLSKHTIKLYSFVTPCLSRVPFSLFFFFFLV